MNTLLDPSSAMLVSMQTIYNSFHKDRIAEALRF